ncbi:MAG TPA: sigma-70 family RNA polymerase sigma factor [Cyclobacteriaceae bacterium]|nr:sigma-70 family RNA polymerase sigma factor [Cyclobacteriaceae bacterium]
MSTPTEAQYQKYKAQLIPYAYNIIGDSLAAEDVVQEILNTFFLDDHAHIQNPDGYLVKSVINRSINAKKSIRVRKKQYIGQWLPVPFHTDDSIYRDIDKRRILDYSLLVLLERLNPRERAVFILKESFDFEHSEIADVIQITVENSRQLYKRARKKLESGGLRAAADKVSTDATLTKLTDAILRADVENVKALLAADVQSHSDGGNIKAAPNVIVGRDNVSKFLQALYGKYFHPDTVVTTEEFNHSPALIFRLGHSIYRCIMLDVRDNLIENVYIIVNPAKLRALGK